MKWENWLEKWGMTSLKISVPSLEMDKEQFSKKGNKLWQKFK